MNNPQKKLYEKIHDEYSKHYYDYWSSQYRKIFVYNQLFNNFNFSEKKIVELACGEGHATNYLIKKFKNTRITGIDISEKAINAYTKKNKADGHVLDITKEFYLKEKFDFALILGGLHLCTNDIAQTLKNISNLLKPNGVLFIHEPNSYFFLESVRKIWHKKDKYFANNYIEALNHKEISKLNKNFQCTFLKYVGGPAYLLICNSLILRIPLFVKNIISPLLIIPEFFWSLLPGYFQITFMARWKKIK